MCTPIFRVFLTAWLILPFATPVLSELQKDTRKEWHYQTPAGMRRVVNQGDGKWLLHFPNGATAKLIEQERTSEYVQLLNPSNRNVQRLFADRGLAKKGGVRDFRKFADGKWVGPSSTNSGVFGATDYKIRVVYFVPRDRTPKTNYEDKIRVIVELMAEIMTRDLRSKGYETEGPQFETKSDEVVVHLLNAEKTAREYNHLPIEKSEKHAKSIFDEVDRRLGVKEQHIVIIFAETYEEGPARRVWPGHLAMAAARPPNGGIGVFSAWILKDDFCVSDSGQQRRGFFDETPIPGRTAIGHKGPNSPRADFIEDGIGGALHELAHTFGLPRHGRSALTNIMSQGFRNLRWNVGVRQNSRLQAGFSKENGWMLMTSRYLNPKVDRADNESPTANLSLERRRGVITATIEAKDDKELRLLTVVEVTVDQGRQLIGARELTGESQTVRLDIDPRTLRNADPTIRIFVVDGGGNHTKITKKLSDSS